MGALNAEGKEIAPLKDGVLNVSINTPMGTFKVWTRTVRCGDDALSSSSQCGIRVLLLHGGPGCSHEQFCEIFDQYVERYEGIEFIYYDQLGSYMSDKPVTDTDELKHKMWSPERFVDEVEQVRLALGLNRDNFFLYGQSWGGFLGMEYALKYPQHLKGLIVSNAMSDAHLYAKYGAEKLVPELPEDVQIELKILEDKRDFKNPRYEELLMAHFYPKHIHRLPASEWSKELLTCFEHINQEIYVFMQGPSECGNKRSSRALVGKRTFG